MIQAIYEVRYGKQDLGIPEAQAEKLPSGSTDDTSPAINQPEAESDEAESPLSSQKLSRQEKWRRKNKKAVAAYMKDWRARKKAGLAG